MDESGTTYDTMYHSTLSFTIIVHVVTYKLLLEATMWNWINVSMCFASLVLYYITVIIINMDGIASLV